MAQDTDDADHHHHRKRSSSSTRRYNPRGGSNSGGGSSNNYKRSSPRGGGGGRGGERSSGAASTTNPLEIYIGNLPPDGDVEEETLRRFLTMYLNMEGSNATTGGPPITNIDISPPNAWVKCATSTQYQTLLNLNGKISYYNSELKIAPSRRRIQQTSSSSGNNGPHSSSTADNDGNSTTTPSTSSSRPPRHYNQQHNRYSNGASDNIDKIKTELLDEKIMNYLLSDSHNNNNQADQSDQVQPPPTSCVPIGKYIKSIGLQDLLKNEHGGLRKFLQERPNRYTIINDERTTIADKHKAALFFIRPVITTPVAFATSTSSSSTSSPTAAASGATYTSTASSSSVTGTLQAELDTTKAQLEKANAKILELQTQILDDKIYNFLNSPTSTPETPTPEVAETTTIVNGGSDHDNQNNNSNDKEEVAEEANNPRPTSSISLGIHLKSLGLSDFMKKEHGGLKRFLQERNDKYEITTTPPPASAEDPLDPLLGGVSPAPKAVFWVTRKVMKSDPTTNDAANMTNGLVGADENNKTNHRCIAPSLEAC